MRKLAQRRFTLVLQEEPMRLLEELEMSTGDSATGVCKRALTVYSALAKLRDEGVILRGERPDGTIVELIVL